METEKVLKILQGIRPGIDFLAEKNLFLSGIFSSLEMVSLVVGINKAFGIEIDPDDIIIENFDSVPAMIALIKKYQAAGR